MNPREQLIDFLPEMYRALVPELFEQPIAEERNATCERCAMCPPPDNPVFSAEEYFSPNTKCCTYHPALPNYAVGGLLRDESAEGAEGRRRIRDKLSRRIGVSPLGVLPPAKQRLLYRHGKRGFGRAESMICPYLEQEKGFCTVWKYREAVCTTWFCKHNNGQDGLKFWQQLRDYLLGTQVVLSAYALRALEWDADRILSAQPRQQLELNARDLDDAPPDDDTYDDLWGEWVGREEEMYIKCYEVVAGLDRQHFATLGGLRHTLELERLENRYRAMREPELPDPLVKSPMLRFKRAADGNYILTSYASIDAMRLRKGVYELLDFFDGDRSNEEVRAAILQHAGSWISDSLLTKLYQHRILVDAESCDA